MPIVVYPAGRRRVAGADGALVMGDGRSFSDDPRVAPPESRVDLAAELDALVARLDKMKASAAAPPMVTGRANVPGAPAPRPDRPPLGGERSRRTVVVALALALLAVATTAVIVSDSRRDGGTQQKAAMPSTTVVLDRPSTAATGTPAETPPRPVAPDPAVGDVRPPQTQTQTPTLVPSPPPPRGPVVSDPETTVVVGSGDSFWTIAERVSTVRGGAMSDVANYWVKLLDANRSRLAQPDNPDLIYPGQQFLLP